MVFLCMDFVFNKIVWRDWKEDKENKKEGKQVVNNLVETSDHFKIRKILKVNKLGNVCIGVKDNQISVVNFFHITDVENFRIDVIISI